jgi:hypothetical protein
MSWIIRSLEEAEKTAKTSFPADQCDNFQRQSPISCAKHESLKSAEHALEEFEQLKQEFLQLQEEQRTILHRIDTVLDGLRTLAKREQDERNFSF